MNLHEYQAKEILNKFGIPITPFFLISSYEEAEKIVKEHHLEKAVLKIQVHAGGRGKAGGIKFAKNQKEILEHAKSLIGMKIVNNQTGPKGLVAHQVMLTFPVEIVNENYLAITIDRKKGDLVLIASPEGGMDIEELAIHSPEKILHLSIPKEGKLRSFHLIRIAKFMGWTKPEGTQIVQSLLKAFQETDALLFEINPLVLTKDNQFVALDAKLVVDENALYRHPEIKSQVDLSQMLPQEAKAYQNELSYVALDGNIGCMVNGAGLAMATMDIIQYYGGKPANFLDVGGGASKEKVAEGFKIILSDPQVKAIFVNIFGGIMNCETLALGIVEAAKELKIEVPLIIRMEGTNVDQGKKILNESNLNILVANTMEEGAKKAVEEAYVDSHK